MFDFIHIHRDQRGLSFVDVIVGVSLMVLIFVGIFSIFKLSIEIIGLNKAKSGALALTNERMEYIRSLSYDDVGTSGGIPAGSIAQQEWISLNGVNYLRRTLIQYVDDDADGLGGADATGITADYKRAKVELSWNRKGATSSVALVSNIVPRGVESLSGGGTLRITVIDASASAVVAADVRVVNSTTSPAIDASYITDTVGQVLIPGAPEASEYEIFVSKTGYTSTQTYSASTTNPNPNPAHLTVTAGNTTSSTFEIDLVAQKTVTTREPVVPNTFDDDFTSSSSLDYMASTSVSVVSGALTLRDYGSGYEPLGYATSSNITPSPLDTWTSIIANHYSSASTSVSYRIYYATSSSYQPIPNGALPGNDSGFSASPIDISGLDPAVYDSLRIEATLSTIDSATTSVINDWSVLFDEGPVPINNVPFTMEGTKEIGTGVLKYSENLQTDGSGEIIINDLEWDNYTITIDDGATGYDVAEACEPQPLGINPGDIVTTDITLVPNTAHSLIVTVRADDNSLLDGASVRLYRSGYDVTQYTGSCGQTHFSGLTSANDYDLDVNHTGYTGENLSNVDVTDDVVQEVVLNP